MASELQELLLSAPQLFIRQKKSWMQILTDLEARNKYELLDPSGTQIGWIIEQKGGLWSLIRRIFLRSHRGFTCSVMDLQQQTLLNFSRAFFWFFSDLSIHTPDGVFLGSAHRRFGILTKRYDLLGPQGQLFATINTAIWRIWTFKIFTPDGREAAEISKKWGGVMRELFTDADSFLVNYGDKASWKPHERAVILATAIAIDFDFFERNNSK